MSDLDRSVNPTLYYLEPLDFQTLLQPCLVKSNCMKIGMLLQNIFYYRRNTTVCNYRHSSLTTKILQDFLNFLSPEIKAIFGQHLLQQQYKLKLKNVRPVIQFVIFSPWNSLQAKNLNYRT